MSIKFVLYENRMIHRCQQLSVLVQNKRSVKSFDRFIEKIRLTEQQYTSRVLYTACTSDDLRLF